MKPLLPDEPIETDKTVSFGFALLWVVNAFFRNDMIFYTTQKQNSMETLLCVKSDFNTPSPELISFIAKAEANFKPLVELNISVDDLGEIVKQYLSTAGNYQAIHKGALKQYVELNGFKLKEV